MSSAAKTFLRMVGQGTPGNKAKSSCPAPLFGKGSEDVELPEKCPACRAAMDGSTFTCPECEHDASPPRWALDTVSLIGSILALAAAGVVAGAPFFLNNPKLVAIIFVAALATGGVSFRMGLGSLVSERLSVGKAVTGVILAIVVVAFSFYLVM